MVMHCILMIFKYKLSFTIYSVKLFTIHVFFKKVCTSYSLNTGNKRKNIFLLTKVHNKSETNYLKENKLHIQSVCSVLIKNSHHFSGTINESSTH